MKFGKSLSNQIDETLPEWRDKFLSYKDLKKKLKAIEPSKGSDEKLSKRRKLDVAETEELGPDRMRDEEKGFIKLLEAELEKFNSFFVEKEEEYIIRLKELQDKVTKATYLSEEMINIRKEIVDFHGEMVLLENYSALNYTGLVKILKKYDKRTGALILLPFIQKVLQQPFFTTDLLFKFVKECEQMLDGLLPINVQPTPSTPAGGDPCCQLPLSTSDHTTHENLRTVVPMELAEIEHMESLYMKSTITALRVLKEIRSGSSTVSVFSLPPLQQTGVDDNWKPVPVIEQLAK